MCSRGIESADHFFQTSSEGCKREMKVTITCHLFRTRVAPSNNATLTLAQTHDTFTNTSNSLLLSCL